MDDFSLVGSWIRLILAFPVVIGLAYLSIRLGSRYQAGMQKTANIQVIERMPMQKNFFLYIVKVGEDYHLMSATDSEVRLLKELDFVPQKPGVDEEEPADFGKYLKNSLNRLGWKK